MPYDIYVIYNLYDIYDIYDMYGALSYTRCMYVDIGVKRSVRTSGMQPTIVDIPQNCFYGKKLKYVDSWFFLCIFHNFLCIFCDHFSNTSRLTIKFQNCISSEAYPIPMGYTKKHQKCQVPRWPGSAASRLTKYTKEILKNTKENQETGYSSVWP